MSGKLDQVYYTQKMCKVSDIDRLELAKFMYCYHKFKVLNLLHKIYFTPICGVSNGSALRLRLTGSVVQPLSCYDLLTYKAIGSNYLSFVVTSMLVFHIATG